MSNEEWSGDRLKGQHNCKKCIASYYPLLSVKLNEFPNNFLNVKVQQTINYRFENLDVALN